MDENERLMTRIVRILLENSVITFGGATIGGLILGPEGLALGAIASNMLHLLSTDVSDWSRILSISTWKHLLVSIVQEIWNYASRNLETFIRMASGVAQFFHRLSNSNAVVPYSY